jgi:PAS domain S-box-containing protein
MHREEGFGDGAPDIVRRVGDALVRSSGDAVIAADRDGKILLWNPGAVRIFGYSEQDAMGRSLDIIVPERLRDPHWQGYARVMSGGESRYGSGDVLAVPAVRSDGSRISIEFTIVPLPDRSGTLMGLIAVVRDVTKRFEEMRALKLALAERKPSAPGP